MRVLFTTPILEFPAAGGPQLRIENSIKALSKVCELDIVSRARGTRETVNRTRDFFQRYCHEYHVLPRLNSSVPHNRYASLAEKLGNLILNTRNISDAAYLLQHIDRRAIDVLWFGYGNISYSLIRQIKSLRPRLKVVCDTDSVWSRFVLRELPYASGLRRLRIIYSGRRKQMEERAWSNFCDVITAVSVIDAEYYRGIAADKGRVHLFSNVIDLENYVEAPKAPPGFKTPSIFLAGTFGNSTSPMNFAARWVLEAVLPLLLKSNSDLHFYIVGRNSELGFGRLTGPNVTVTGRLDSVLPYLCNTDVALVPLKFESGTRFKILEAGACKIPLVSTTLGAEGIPVVHGVHLLIADNPVDFANAIEKILHDKDLASTLALNCYNLVKSQFSIETLMIEAKNILGYLSRA